MNNVWIFILIMVFGVFPFGMTVYWLKYKRTIIFKTAFAIIVTAIIVGIISFIVGKYGLIHLIWYIPVGYLALLTGNLIFRSIVQRPIKKTTEIIEKISNGDLEINIDEKLKQQKDEIGAMNQSLTRMINTFRETADFARDIGENNLDTKIEMLSEKDYLRMSLIDMKDALAEANKIKEEKEREEQKRSWSNEGLAKLNEILRQNEDIEETSYKIVSFLVDYLDANQGGIFIRVSDEGEKPVYELKASYAYSRRKYKEKTFELGEGLLGACAIEKKEIHLTEIPNDYIEISSGLGNSNPRSLILLPMKLEDTVLGVMEIASFKNFKEHQIKFLKQASLSIASSLNMIETNLRTSTLLEKTQQQAEEMAAQEEEMRQNMEEMQATSEEADRRSEKMKEIAREVYDEEEKLRAFIEKIKETE